MKFFLTIACCLGLSFSGFSHEMFLCENAVEMFTKSLQIIAEAKSSVEISTPFLGGKISRELLATLEKRLQECPKLKVHILAGGSFLEDQDEAYLHRLKVTFPNRFFYLLSGGGITEEPDITSMRNHLKLICIDERYFVIGGTNLDEGLCTDGSFTPPQKKPKDKALFVSLPAGARDGDLMVKSDEISKKVRAFFFLIYALFEHFDHTKSFIKDPYHFQGKTRYFPVDERLHCGVFDQLELVEVKNVHVIFAGPFDGPCNGISSFYREVIDQAKHSIYLSNVYFTPIEPLLQALMSFVNRGGTLELLTNGYVEGITPEFNQNFAWGNRVYYVPILCGREFYLWQKYTAISILKETVSIYEYRVPDVVYHKKAMIVDDRYYIIGSYNLNTKSDIGDYEVIIYVDSPEIAKKAKSIFEKEKTLSEKIKNSDSLDWYFDPWISFFGNMQKKTQGFS